MRITHNPRTIEIFWTLISYTDEPFIPTTSHYIDGALLSPTRQTAPPIYISATKLTGAWLGLALEQ